MTKRLTGGCLCGNNRFSFAAEAVTDAGYCHCSMCRKSTGAPVLIWAIIPTDRIEFTTKDVRRFASSEHGCRYFCPHCGSQIYFQDTPDAIELNTGNLDDPSAIVPSVHIFVDSRIEWLAIDDDLPIYSNGSIPAPEVRPKSRSEQVALKTGDGRSQRD